jgi:Na+/H+ antiporter NhaC
LIGGVNSEFVKVVKRLKRLGIENNWIGGYLYGKSTYNWNRMCIYLGRMCIYLLFGRLLKLDLKNPQILSGELVKNLLLAVNFLLYIEMGSEDIASKHHICPYIQKTLKRK